MKIVKPSCEIITPINGEEILKHLELCGRVENGKPRVERFCDMCIDLYDSFEKGYLTLDDIHKCLWEEAGIKIERSSK